MKTSFQFFFRVLFVSLSFVGSAFAQTYYIDYASGADTNTGTSKTSPWKSHPYMAGWAGGNKYTHMAGDNFIFKGGVTWASAALPLKIQVGGTASAYDYYGADKTWYAGSSFTRPVFDGGYAVSDIITVGSVSYVNIDNLELSHVNSASNYGTGLISGAAPSFLNITNCYLHGWRTTASTDDAHGGVIMGSYGPNVDTIVIDGCEIENKENNTRWNGVMFRMVGTIRNTLMHDNSSAILFALDMDHSTMYNISYPQSGFDGSYHFNGFYLDAMTMNKTVGYIRNSVFHDIGGGANMAYPNPRGASMYIYNNLFYGVMSAQCAIEIDPYAYGAGGSQGSVYVYNNTVANYSSNYPAIHVVNRGGNPKLGVLEAKNNYVINANAVTDGGSGSVGTLTTNNNLLQTSAQATSSGYTLNKSYVPASATSPTVDAGTSVSCSGCTSLKQDLLGNLRPQGSGMDIGAYEYASNGQSTLTLASPVNLRIQ